MKLEKKKLIRGISFILILTLFLAGIVWAVPNHTVEPDNPLVTKADDLRVDISMQGGASLDSESTEEIAGIQADSSESEQENQEDLQEEMPEEETTEEEIKEEQELEETEEISEELPPETEEGEDISENVQGEEGEKDEELPGDNETGENPSENGDMTEEQPGTGEEPGEDEHGLVTDLSNRIVMFSELENDTLGFYAYYSDKTINADIKVNYKHKSETGNGSWLSASGENYTAKLKLGVNYITIYYTDGNGERSWTRFTITYQADKADAATPERGAHPPIISTNLDDWVGDFETNHFKFTVDARTWKNERIYSDCIEVCLNGKLVTNPTGSEIFEYDLYFSKPVSGDYSDYTVTVLAWDKEGNSRFVEYHIRYLAKGEGEKLDPVTVTIDATTVSCGIVGSATVEIVGGDTAADAVLKMFEQNGYTPEFKGSVESSFYLIGISGAYAFRGISIESRLQELLERDGIAMKPPGTQDKLSEFNFTEGSGWLYFINGALCPGVGMNEWSLQGGENITLRFTLAYGKDIGASSAGQGNLSSYCAKWINGQIIELGHDYQESDRVEATATEDGYVEYTCTKCLDIKEEILPATGETEEPDPPVEPEQPDPPVEPEQPDPPVEPEQPDPPVEPEQPDPPVEPEQPEPPVEPEQPEPPVEPEQPDPPVEPEQPTEPEETDPSVETEQPENVEETD